MQYPPFGHIAPSAKCPTLPSESGCEWQPHEPESPLDAYRLTGGIPVDWYQIYVEGTGRAGN